jgi:two-component system response regulator RegX3
MAKSGASEPPRRDRGHDGVAMNRPTLLVVEDDEAIAEPLIRGLEHEGYATIHAPTGAAALDAPEVDLVLLDLGLPDIDGYDVCRELRSRSEVPIIVITARGEEVDRVIGLELGADDYVVKPFGFRELVARIRAIARRTASRTGGPPALAGGVDPATDVVRTGPLTVDIPRRRVTVDNEEITLTRKEFDLLALLATRAGIVCRREEILEQVWDPHWYGPTKTLDVHIASLRRKLGRPELIETVRGVGFRLVGEPGS